MSAGSHELSERYLRALQSYFAAGDEDALLEAYELGRGAVAEGISLLEMTAVHEEVLLGVLGRTLTADECARIARATDFLRETLAAFDMTQRGYQQANAALALVNEELKRRTAELEAAVNELEAFSYSVSHDLRAPLRAIDGFSRIVIEEHAADLAPDVQGHLERVRDNVLQMGRLIDDLLAFSRLSRQPLDKRQVRPADIARQTLDDLRAEQEGRRVEVHVGPLPPCHADPSLLRQVYANLLANALKFTRGREPAVIEVGCRQESGERLYFVRDNGVGFDMRYADKLFGVFQRLHRAEEYEGTGVGLAIVQRIVHRHGGRVWAEAEPNRGATFYFTI